MIFLFIAILGLEFGSFANVCIYRWPRNLSIYRPVRSHCPWCFHQIAFWENIPLLSYFILRGACRHCRSRISIRYPLVEFTVALMWVAGWELLRRSELPIQIPFLITIGAFLFFLVVTTLTDLDWKIIPDEASYALILIGLITAYWNPLLSLQDRVFRIENSFFGACAGALPLWLIAIIGRKILGKEAMGGGDIKLLAGIGTILGWQAALMTIFLGSIIGCLAALVGLASRKLRRGQYIAFGPFLNAAALTVFVFKCVQPPSFDPLQLFFTFP